jgi:hypothetical protein
MSQDLNKIAKIEQAIKEKYGDEAIQNPKKNWNQEKENKYLKDLNKFHNRHHADKETTQKEGFTIRQKKDKQVTARECPVCNAYSFSFEDDLYMTKYECCFNCYVKYVEDREERWNSGWRPNN